MKTKEIKLDGYTLPDNSICTMKNALDRSRHIKKEIGLTMCSSRDNVITLRGEHKGEENQVSINRRCNEGKGEEYIGYYHTHPEGTSKATSVDLRLCGTSKVLCVGGKTEKKWQGEPTNDSVGCYTWKDNVISVQEGEKLFADVHKGRQEPHNSEYKSHFDCLSTIGIYADEQEILHERLKSIGFPSIRKLATALKFQELNTAVDKEVDKYYNRTEIKLGED